MPSVDVTGFFCVFLFVFYVTVKWCIDFEDSDYSTF